MRDEHFEIYYGRDKTQIERPILITIFPYQGPNKGIQLREQIAFENLISQLETLKIYNLEDKDENLPI